MSKRLLSLTMLISLLLAMSFAGPAAAEGDTPTEPTPTPEATATVEALPEEPAPTATEAAPTQEPTPTGIPQEEPAITIQSESITAASVQPQVISILLVKKDAFGNYSQTWTWTIDKTGSTADLLLATGQSYDVTYGVTVNATLTDTGWSVSGTIAFRNTSDSPAEVVEIVDQLSDGTLAAVTCPSFALPYVLPAGYVSAPCTYTASGSGTRPTSNTVTVNVSDGAGGVVSGGAATVAVQYALPTITDSCVDVTDTQAGDLGTVCASQGSTSFTFTYSRTIGPFASCGDYTVDNIATFTTNDTLTSGSDGWSVAVNVPCLAGCSLTPGYWKTHSAYGPAPYDNTWALIGEGTTFFLSGQSWYQVLWTSPSGGNAYYILAHAYIAAKLNGLNGADTSAVTAQIAHAEALFAAYSPSSSLSRPVREDFINTASILDQYNNGLIGPGHCSE